MNQRPILHWMLLFAAACTSDKPVTTDSDSATPPTTTPTVVNDYCNGLDDDGDGEIDEDAAEPGIFYADDDGDDYGATDSMLDCNPGGWVEIDGDCDDSDPFVNPDALDTNCDGIDNDCNGVPDDRYREGYRLISLQADGDIVVLDMSNGAIIERIPMSNPTFQAASTTLSEGDMGIAFTDVPASLAEFDGCTGDITQMAGINETLTGAISFANGMDLYGLNGAAGTLVSIDPFTGTVSTVGSLGSPIGNAGIAWDCTTETMYFIDGETNQLYTVDITTGQATMIYDTMLNFDQVGLAFHHDTRSLLAATGTRLWRIDPANQTETLIGTIESGLNDLAFFPPCQN